MKLFGKALIFMVCILVSTIFVLIIFAIAETPEAPAHIPREHKPPDCGHLYDVGRHCAWAACMLVPCQPRKAKPAATSDAVLAEMWRTDI